jgi:hypothetical protein
LRLKSLGEWRQAMPLQLNLLFLKQKLLLLSDRPLN